MKKLTITLILIPLVGTTLYATKTTPGTHQIKTGHHCPRGQHNGLSCVPSTGQAGTQTGGTATVVTDVNTNQQNVHTGGMSQGGGNPQPIKPIGNPNQGSTTPQTVIAVPVVYPPVPQVTTNSVTATLKPVPVVYPPVPLVTTNSVTATLNPPPTPIAQSYLVPPTPMKVPPTPMVKPNLIPPAPMKVPPTPMVKPNLIPPAPMKVPPTPMVKPNLIPPAPMKVPPTPMVKPNLIPPAPMKVPPTPMVKPNLIPPTPMKVPLTPMVKPTLPHHDPIQAPTPTSNFVVTPNPASPAPMVKPNLIPSINHIAVEHGNTHGTHLPVAPKAHNCQNTITTSHHHENPGQHVVLQGGTVAGAVVHTSAPTHHINTGSRKGAKPITSGRYHTRTGYDLNVIEPGIQNKEVAVYRTDDARQMKYKDAIEIDHTGGFLMIDLGTRAPEYSK